MSDNGNWFRGYGRAWTEDKAHGIARIFQFLREPATTNTYYAIFAFGIIAWAVLMVLMAAASRPSPL